MFLLHKAVRREQGHGFLRKTKLGLLSGIILTGALSSLFLTGVVNADEQPNSSTTSNTVQTPPSENNQFETETVHTVKEAELKAKVEEVKALGVSVTQTETENVGKAQTSSEVVPLRTTAEEKVDAQIRELESAKAEQEQVKADRAKIDEFKNTFVNANYIKVKSRVVAQVNGRDIDEDVSKESTVSPITSSGGETRYLKANELDLTDTQGLYSAVLKPTTEEVTETFVKMPTNIGVTNNYATNRINIGYPARIVELTPNTVYSYTITPRSNSILSSVYGIGSIETTVKFEYTLPEETKLYATFSSKPIETHVIIKNLTRRAENHTDFIGYTRTYTYKDKQGNIIPIKDLYAKFLDVQAFKGKGVITSSDIPDSKLSEFELRSAGADYTYRQETSLLGETTISQKEYIASKVVPNKRHQFTPRITYAASLNNVELSNTDRAINGVSRTFHTVTYTEVQNKGLVTQKFVNEQGIEIAPSIRSELKDVGSAISLTHPTDLDFENKRYTFKEQDKQDITEIVKGETVITYVYKQKYENNLPPVETETKIPIATTYVEDKTIDYGTEIVESNGSEGKIVTITSKIVNELDGTVTDGKPTEKETPMVPKVVKVGTKPKVVETPIEFPTTYEADPTKEVGITEVKVAGVLGKTITTTTYTFDPDTWRVTVNPSTETREEPTTKVVLVGTKSSVTTTSVPIETEVISDPDLFEGEEIEVSKGKEGVTTVTVNHELDRASGKVTDLPPVTTVTPMEKRVIHVGTKKRLANVVTHYYKVGTTEKIHEDEIQRDLEVGSTYTTSADFPEVVEVSHTNQTRTETISTSVYKLVETPNTATGILSREGAEVVYYFKPVVTTEVLQKNPTDAPTLSLEEYTQPIGTSGEPLVNTEVEFSGGVTPNDAPKHELGEYTQPIGKSGEPETHSNSTYLKPLGTNGDPLVNTEVEFTGGVTPNEVPKLDVPTYDNGTVPNTAPIKELDEFKGGVNPFDAPTLDKPEFKGGVTPFDAPALNKPELKVPEKPQKVSEQPKTPTEGKTTPTPNEPLKEQKRAYENKPTLPNTGTSGTDFVFSSLGALGILGALAFGRWKKSSDLEN